MKLFICQTLIRPIHTYSAFVHGVIHQWNYIMHTFSSFSTLGWCQPSVILIHFLTGQAPCSQLECQLFSLPCHFDGLNLLNPASMCDQFNSSQRISGPLADFILQQSEQFHIPSLQAIKTEIHRKRLQHLKTQQLQ